jgi:hypothetical protein
MIFSQAMFVDGKIKSDTSPTNAAFRRYLQGPSIITELFSGGKGYGLIRMQKCKIGEPYQR